MKRSILMALFAVFVCIFKAQAQSSLLATLNHNGEISIFYGATALQQAHAAAAHGDVITMSSGTFASTDITKAVTIRGAGMLIDTVRHTEPTVLANSFSISVADTTAERLTIEGIYTNQQITVDNLKNALFLKSRFKTITYNDVNTSVMKDLTFIHCRVSDRVVLPKNSSASFMNSVVMYVERGSNTYCSFINCYITNPNIGDSEFKNCIINSYASGRYSGASTSTYYNNLHISGSSGLLTSLNSTNKKISTNAAGNLYGSYSDDATYVLTDAQKALIKGTDGKEVGIYGGSIPYDPTPSNPQITKFNVAAKSTADGKLSVDIEVSSAE